MMKLAEALKKYRKEHEVTQAKMAKLLGVTVTTLSRWENEHVEPQHKLIKERVRQVIGRINGTVRLTESVSGREDPVAGVFWRAQIVANEHPKRLIIEHGKGEIVLRLKVK